MLNIKACKSTSEINLDISPLSRNSPNMKYTAAKRIHDTKRTKMTKIKDMFALSSSTDAKDHEILNKGRVLPCNVKA